MGALGIDGLVGTWNFSEDKSAVIYEYSYEVAGITMWTIESTDTIVKLKLNNLGLKRANGDKYYYEYFSPYNLVNSSINTVEESRLLNLPSTKRRKQ